MSTHRESSTQKLPLSQRVAQSLSQYSTRAREDVGWCSADFMLGAAMVIIQEGTHKIVVVHDKRRRWFFPRGRKDVGESLETAALREGHEESGYRAQFMPHWGINQQPDQRPNAYNSPTCEPIFLTTMYWPPKYKKQADGKMVCVDHGGEYLITWYLGSIPENAVRETGTGMPDEVDYVSHLLTFEEARERVPPAERRVLNWAWRVYCDTLHYEQYLAEEAAKEVSANPNGSQSATGSTEAEESGDDQPIELGVAGGAAEGNLER
ncbi:hypothetical protein DFP72DRAFT_910637 [Ephemerocybe angulata]|uniref:Nudix hydrolase domain-containing protein n=1 Tax=Ephemerocybe angulata TaxID=980116 RepID=A0A8H6M2Y0_9AGAR|nr:hypothetical protein DFP72DRAFT_910637 [Tulosesus angulatus]